MTAGLHTHLRENPTPKAIALGSSIVMGDAEQVDREVEHLRVVITRLGQVQPEGGKSESPICACSDALRIFPSVCCFVGRTAEIFALFYKPTHLASFSRPTLAELIRHFFRLQPTCEVLSMRHGRVPPKPTRCSVRYQFGGPLKASNR